MDQLERYRQQARRHVLRALGVSERARGFVGEVEATGHEAAILALPFYGGTAAEEQSLQNASGTPFFMVGISAVDSSDPIA